MRVRIVQKDINDLDHAPYLETAQHDRVDLICFGELSLTGCVYEPRSVSAVHSVFCTLNKYSIAAMLGMARPTGSGLRNSYVYYKSGRYQIYDKINLFPPFNEPGVYEPGDTPGLFDTDRGLFGVAICYDIRFPSLFDRLRDQKPDLIFVPAAFPRVRIGDWRSLLSERATQTGVTVVGINAVGSDGVNEFGGASMVVQPDGTVLAEADETSESVLDVTFDLAARREVR